ncbi:MAG: site-specific integrase [Sulfuricurvum sp.]|nr:site-specific integrase [Sulfuricurvum sp.]
MAINRKDYPNKVRTNLSANNEFNRFLYIFKHNAKQYNGIIDLSEKQWGKRDRIKFAEMKFLEAKDQIENSINSDATVNAMVQRYIDTLPEGNYKKNRMSYYDRNVKPSLGSKKISTIMPHHIQTIVDQQIKNGDSPRTAKQAIEILSPALRIARANQIMFHNPCEDVKIKLPKTKKIVSNATERLKIVHDAIMSLYAHDPFYRAFFLLALQGRRRGEIINLLAEDVILDQDYYIIRDTKNGEDQKIYLPPKVKEALLEFISENGILFKSRVTGRKINTVHKQILKIREIAGDWFSMHYTRNLIVSAMAEKGVDSIHLSGALGHNDPNTIIKYLSLNYTLGSRMASEMIDDVAIIVKEEEEESI